MKSKRIEWSYATSPNATRFKFKDGCYTVEIVHDEPKPATAIAGFPTIDAARTYANSLNWPWNKLTR